MLYEVITALLMEQQQDTQVPVESMDVFKAAVIQPGAPDPETGRVPISLELKPKMKQSRNNFV